MSFELVTTKKCPSDQPAAGGPQARSCLSLCGRRVFPDYVRVFAHLYFRQHFLHVCVFRTTGTATPVLAT